MSLLSNSNKLMTSTKKLNMINGETMKPYKRFETSECTPTMLAEYRRLQHELQCQEALLVLMQKLKSNQRLISSTNNNGVKQKTMATKLNQQSALTDGKTTPITATKQQQSSSVNNANRSTPNKPGHPNQYTVNRPNVNSSNVGISSKNSVPQVQATRQSNLPTNNSSGTATSATRLSSTPTTTTTPTTSSKTSSTLSNTSNSSKSNGVASEQHLLNAKLALRKQLEQTLLQIPTPKPSTCDLTFIPSVNGWSEFLAFIGLEQAFNIYNDIVSRRPPSELLPNMPHVCANCGTDWSVTWHEITSSNNENNTNEEKILCDRCTKTSQKKLLKQDHSNRLRQAFIKALQQEKELDAKFQQQSSSSSSSAASASSSSATSTNANSGSTTTSSTTSTSTSIKQSPSSSSISSQSSTKQVQSSSKHLNKPLSTKTSSNHHHHHHHHHHNSSSSNNHNHHSHSHHHHSSSSSSKTTNSSSSSKSHHNNPSSTAALAGLGVSPAETLASTLAALQNTEQMELFQKHFLSNMLPFAVANQAAAAALAAKSTQQQQQQALAAFPAMAATLMRQPNPAQYLLDMIPQAAKQQQQHHHHSK